MENYEELLELTNKIKATYYAFYADTKIKSTISNIEFSDKSKWSIKLMDLLSLKYEDDTIPEDEDEFRNYFIEETTEGDILKNVDLLKRRMLGIISYYRGGKPQFYPTVNPVIFEEIPMSDHQFVEYKRVRDVERDKEKAGAVQKLLGKVTTG